jgi:methylmalonyl-CoA mutase C-terminal domain/subunit
MEVIYLGLHQSARQIASAAVQEDADVVALSILSGAHVPICRKVLAELEDQGIKDDVVLIVGGTILDEDIPVLKNMGVAEVFPPGSPIDAGVEFLRNRFSTSE